MWGLGFEVICGKSLDPKDITLALTSSLRSSPGIDSSLLLSLAGLDLDNL